MQAFHLEVRPTRMWERAWFPTKTLAYPNPVRHLGHYLLMTQKAAYLL
jgi:hypothetical protein